MTVARHPRRRTPAQSRSATWPRDLRGHGRQFDDLEPVSAEHVHRLHQPRKGDRLRDEGVHAEPIAPDDVRLQPRRREHHDWDVDQRRVALDTLQRFAPVHLRHVEVEENQPGTRSRASLSRELATLVQVVEQLLAVLDEPKLVRNVRVLQRLLGQHPVVLIIVADEDRDRNLMLVLHHHGTYSPAACVTGRVTMNVAPWPVVLVAAMLPPCRSTIFRQIARPMPEPSYCARAWSLSNMRKIFSPCSSLNPIPLSDTVSVQIPSPEVDAPRRTTGGESFRRNLKALPNRFCSSRRICNASASITGSSPTSTRPPDSEMDVSRSVTTSRAIAARSAVAKGSELVATCEYARRSLIRVRMRAAALSMRSRYWRAFPSSSGPADVPRRSPNDRILRSGSCRSCDATNANSLSAAFERCSSRRCAASRRSASLRSVTSSIARRMTRDTLGS